MQIKLKTLRQAGYDVYYDEDKEIINIRGEEPFEFASELYLMVSGVLGDREAGGFTDMVLEDLSAQRIFQILRDR